MHQQSNDFWVDLIAGTHEDPLTLLSSNAFGRHVLPISSHKHNTARSREDSVIFKLGPVFTYFSQKIIRIVRNQSSRLLQLAAMTLAAMANCLTQKIGRRWWINRTTQIQCWNSGNGVWHMCFSNIAAVSKQKIKCTLELRKLFFYFCKEMLSKQKKKQFQPVGGKNMDCPREHSCPRGLHGSLLQHISVVTIPKL